MCDHQNTTNERMEKSICRDERINAGGKKSGPVMYIDGYIV
jgi:hypothetical protein